MKKEFAIILNPIWYLIAGLAFILISILNDLFTLSYSEEFLSETSFIFFTISLVLYLVPIVLAKYMPKKGHE